MMVNTNGNENNNKMKFVAILLGLLVSPIAIVGARNCLKATIAPSNKNATSGTYVYPNVKGTVRICFPSLTSNWGTLNMEVVNLRPNIKAGIVSGGGVHVHVGTSCPTNNTQLGHYYKPAKTGYKKDGDPWYPQKSSISPNGTGYTTSSTGQAKTTFQFNQGYGYNTTVGKVVVIHDANTTVAGNKRIACGKLVKV